MKFKLFDVVRATKDFPLFAVKAGDVGAVVEVYEDGEYEVEFCGPDGETLAMFAIPEGNLTAAHGSP